LVGILVEQIIHATPAVRPLFSKGNSHLGHDIAVPLNFVRRQA
jgi:hypothetical protein